MWKGCESSPEFSEMYNSFFLHCEIHSWPKDHRMPLTGANNSDVDIMWTTSILTTYCKCNTLKMSGSLMLPWQAATCQLCPIVPVNCCSVMILERAMLSVRNPRRLGSLRRDVIVYNKVPIGLATPAAPHTFCAWGHQEQRPELPVYFWGKNAYVWESRATGQYGN